jgi:DNA adenine methylase
MHKLKESKISNKNSLFIWAGGKNKMLKHYAPMMPSSIEGYCEPFFGGGAMFVHVMQQYKPKNVVINDINSAIMNIYAAIRDDCDGFIANVEALEQKYLPLSKADRKKLYMDVRHRHAYDFEQMSKSEEAATLYFLMRTSFNGIYQHNKNTNNRYGTGAGLLNQTDRIFDRDAVKWWHDALQGVKIMSCDWRCAVSAVETSGSNHGTFMFLDPPYRGCFTSYGQQFTDDDQKALAEWANTQSNVMLCNRDTGDTFWQENRGKLNLSEFDVTYTAGRRKREDDGTHSAKKAKEVLLWQCDKFCA